MDRYRFEEELGRGAMGVVYRAQDLRLGRPVAIKILHPLLTNELGAARFQSEIRIAAGLHHGNIIGVHESGEAEGRLYCVMDYIGGETLRDRLTREKQLSVEDALHIAEEVAAGLQYAHDHGVVHRDVKPENIILAEGRACIMDFGLARVFGDVDTERLTASGFSVGTPHYLSPEQAAAEKDVGPKADQYALACVLYEMLAGEPPFTGPSAAAIAMRHVSQTPAPIRTRRKTATLGIEAAILKAMEKVPADRYESVVAWMHALRLQPTTSARQTAGHDAVSPSRFRSAIVVIAAACVVAMLAFAAMRSLGSTGVPEMFSSWVTPALDTNRLVILVAGVTPTSQAANVETQLRSAIGSWTGISQPSPLEILEVVRTHPDPIDKQRGVATARALKAGLVVLLDVSRLESAKTVRADLFNSVDRVLLASTTYSVSDSVPETNARVAYALLFRGDDAERLREASRGTRNADAFRAYVRAKAAMKTWKLPAADSALSVALQSDPNFPQASLELANVKLWESDMTAGGARLADNALNGAEHLTALERQLATGLQQLGKSQYEAACRSFGAVLHADPLNFAAWYGSAECERLDDTVVADLRSPSRHVFRSSRRKASLAMDRALDLLPAIDPCCIARALRVQRRHFAFTSSTQIRVGTGVRPDTTLYGAYPEQSDDTIAFIPYPMGRLHGPPPSLYAKAVDQQRRQLLYVATKRAAPLRHADALEFMAEALDLVGDRAAIDTLEAARTLATDPGQRLRLAIGEEWIRLKYAVPRDTAALVRIRERADSILRWTPPGNAEQAQLLSSLAMLVGDVELASTLAERASAEGTGQDVPASVQGTASALLVAAIGGARSDAIAQLHLKLSSGIANGVIQERQPHFRAMLLGRALALAFPHYRTDEIQALGARMPLLEAERAFLRGNHAQTLAVLDGAGKARIHMRPADLTLDALYVEGWLLAALGDTASALRRIEPTLDALTQMPARQFQDPTMAGALFNAMVLRAQLRRHEPEVSRTWASAVVALTSKRGLAVNSVRATASRLLRQ